MVFTVTYSLAYILGHYEQIDLILFWSLENIWHITEK